MLPEMGSVVLVRLVMKLKGRIELYLLTILKDKIQIIQQKLLPRGRTMDL